MAVVGNCSLSLFKVWFGGYLIGVFLAVALVGTKEGWFSWGNNETENEWELYLQYRRDAWIPFNYESRNWTLFVPFPPIIHGIDYLMHINKGEDRTLANDIAEEVSVFCMVMTVARHHENRTQLVKDTWGSRCDKLVFMSDEPDNELPAIALRSTEGDPWARDNEAFHYVYHRHRDAADWFLRTDDKTYIIMENLRYMLKNYSSSEATYFGYMPDSSEKNDYLSAGYVLSKAALERLVNNGPILCQNSSLSDDPLVDCFRNVHIKVVNTSDPMGRARFFPYNPTQLGRSSTGASDYAISFHNVIDNYLHLMEYLMYHLRPYGIVAKYPATEASA